MKFFIAFILIISRKYFIIIRYFFTSSKRYNNIDYIPQRKKKKKNFHNSLLILSQDLTSPSSINALWSANRVPPTVVSRSCVAQSDIYDILENELAYARYAGTSTSTQNSSNLSYHGMNPETMTSIVLI